MLQPIDTLAAQREALATCSTDVFIGEVMTPLERFWKPFLAYFSPQEIGTRTPP